ncbi:hypothetical protein [Mameliella alba]|uniref:hypothetical protein n=1 Tax=Mameliella alba TaxID=561184 RepID=UPI000B52A4D2|nr:hypothetical protein [Mameliella alba]OWV44208.1 hypothetical protein CDZ95_05850 [Mameliella alba]BBU58510.1 hypothetical protein KU6B_47750 [Mameliella alba]
MTQNFAASVKNWTEKAKRNVDVIVKQSAQDVARQMTQPKDGLVRGAPFETGVVPVDEGQLIGSVIVQVGGTLTGQGNAASAQPPDYASALAGFETGDTIIVGFTAPYAPMIEYGWSFGADDTNEGTGDVDVPGRFMVRQAVQNWQAIVDANAGRFKD